MPGNQILIVDDEIGIRELLSEILQEEGYSVRLAENANEARKQRNQHRPDLVLLDIWMPDTDGITLLKEWGNNGQLTMPVVMMSGHATVDTAVEATRIGAVDFLEKPIALQKLLATVQKALRPSVAQLRPELNLSSLGKGPVILDLKKQLERVLPLKTPVLLVGEPGVGFEACAHFFTGPGQQFIAPENVEKALDAPSELLQQATNEYPS
ncbi:MAG: response regulator [Burkholderiales bacterium]